MRCYTYTALFRYVVLIVNGADDLTNVLDGARLVGEACVHCGLCNLGVPTLGVRTWKPTSPPSKTNDTR